MPKMERDPHSHALVFYQTPEEAAFENLQKSHDGLKKEVEELKATLQKIAKKK